VLDVLFPPHHEGERPDGMATVLGAVAGGLATAQVGTRERAGEEIGGDGKAAEQRELALPQAGGLGAEGSLSHLFVILQ